MEALVSYHWPGNVRELKNLIERACIICTSGTIEPEHLPLHIRNAGKISDRQESSGQNLDLASQEQSLLFAALEKNNWNQSSAAKDLGITRSALRYRLQKYGIKKE